MIYAHYTPMPARSVNQRRAGTVRVTSSNPDPIQIKRDFDTVLLFAFREHNRNEFLLTGRQVIAELIDHNNVTVAELTVNPESTDGLGSVFLSRSTTNALEAGLYSLTLIYTDELQRRTVVHTSHSRPRFIVSILD